jgi:uncharacterized protein (UPF0276 family)
MSQLSPRSFGLGLRPDHYQAILDSLPAIDFFEIISENYMVPGGRPHHFLSAIQSQYPLIMHGVSLSIGSQDALNSQYLDDLAALADVVKPLWVSDHLCFTGAHGINLHDLLPLPYTEATAAHVASRIRAVQQHLGRPFILENVSSYLSYRDSTLTEWDFVRQIAEEADCGLLLDVNNIYVSSINHGFDPLSYLDAIPAERVWQIHLAGHRNHGHYIVDTHDEPIADPVFALYTQAIQRFGPRPTMIERDDNIPELDVLLAELELVKKASEQASKGSHS